MESANRNGRRRRLRQHGLNLGNCDAIWCLVIEHSTTCKLNNFQNFPENSTFLDSF